MTLRGSPDVGFLIIGGREFANDLTSINDTNEAVIEETTGLGVSGDTHAAVGVKRYSASLNGFYNTAAGASLEALALTGEVAMLYAIEPNTLGNHCIIGNVFVKIHTKEPAKDALHKISAELMSGQGALDGIIQATLTARTYTANGSANDNAASSANGAASALGITALDLDGGTDIVIKEQDSPDNVVWSDLITYDTITSLTNALRAQFKTVTGTVDRYTRTTWAFNANCGAGKTITFATALTRL